MAAAGIIQPSNSPWLERLMEKVLQQVLASACVVDLDDILLDFLSLASYYSRFIVGVVDIAHPLHQLTEKAQQFQWSPSSQDAFDRLRRALITVPVLVILDQSKPFIVDTDASNDSVRAVLYQVGEQLVLASNTTNTDQ
ncbi:hypothetical protein AAFF_G00192670 [Aldrovandia affinis]|uniref:Reverse transcriptase/retrotransposon-derived protein RNase H-like domain-containing protein n=1 Tax=Aldrovandia affinis TaxID=143900 RepID=A0AAD7RJ13_9TELE|nr:hypothetical protein AAFF_G00192670 [Aldrovandia affinis]